ncbi:MAG: ribosome-associated translation inhibitor RaiA [bacterium]|nr:ribosome-associated translation inhibitor RaiA [bacterium]
MRFTITARHIKLTPSVSVYAREKLAKMIGKHFKNPTLSQAVTIDIEFLRNTRHRKGKIWQADLVMTLPKEKAPIYAKATDEDIHTAIDLLAKEVESEIQKYKGRFQARVRRGARAAKKVLRLDPSAQFPKGGRPREEGN